MTAPTTTSPPSSDTARLREAVDELRTLVEPHIVGAKHVRVRVITARRVLSSNDALAEEARRLREALEPLVNAARGLTYGEDWNNGIAAKKHGYRQRLLEAVPAACRAFGVEHWSPQAERAEEDSRAALSTGGKS